MPASLPITFPLQGVSENFAFSQQPVTTSRDALNMRGLDPLTGRARGAQRPGWNKYNTALVNGSNGVLDLGVVVGDDSQITYSEFSDANIAVVYSGKTPAGQDCLAAAMDFDGNIYGLDGDTGFVMWSPEGEEVQSFTFPVVSGELHAIAVDDARNVYVATSTGGTQTDSRLWKATAQLDGSYKLGWELSLVNQGGASGAGNVCYATQIKVVGTTMYVLVSDITPTKAEAEVHVYNGVDANAVPSAPSYSFTVLAAETLASGDGLVAYGMDVNGSGDIVVSATELDASGVPDDLEEQYLVRYDSTGTESWKKDAGTLTHGGLGLSCVFDSNDGVAAMGSHLSGAASGEHITYFRSDGTLEWKGPNSSIDLSATPFIQIAADSFRNVWAPRPDGTSYSAKGYDEEGTEIASLGDAATDLIRTYGVLVPPTIPDYADDAVTVPEFIYTCCKRLGGGNVTGVSIATPAVITTSQNPHGMLTGGYVRVDGVGVTRKVNGTWVVGAVDADDTLELVDSTNAATWISGGGYTPLTSMRAYRLVDSSISTGSQRTQKVLAVAGGNIEASVGGTAWTAPTGGTAALDSTSEFIDGASFFGKRYYTDGLTTVVYDLVDDEVTTLTASKGEVPKRCKLMATWRARLVHARPADDGHNWFMSAAEDPTDYDYNPIAVLPTSAVAGNNSDAGRVPDIINTLVPWSDDLLFFGCDHSIWRMTGDPLAGGQIDNVSKTIGMAFGASWARDPIGILYFFSTEGGIYRMPPVGLPERISVDWIERRLQDVDLSSRHARLEWDFRNEGLCIFLVARDGVTNTTQEEHYFWEAKTAGWWPQKFAFSTGTTTGFEPLSTLVLDGDDPSDRLVLIGCEDGYVRKQDETEKADDGVAIDSYVVMGPFTYKEAEMNLRVLSLQATLASDQGGVNWQLFASDSPDRLGSAKASGALGPGRSPYITRARTAGVYFWLRLQSANLEHWAFEGAVLQVAQAGRKRVLA